MDVTQVAVQTLARWRRDILACGRECFRLVIDEFWQQDYLVSIQNNPRTAAVACKGPGKTFCLAVGVWWYLLVHEDANVAITSISGDNMRDGIIKELALIRSQSPVLQAAFEMTHSRIVSRERPATWWASFRTWSKTADAQAQSATLAGLHATHMAFFIDEAGSIPLAVAVTAEAALSTGRDCRLVLAGNPTSLDGPLYAAAVTQRHLWHVVQVTGDPKDPKRSQRVDLTWAQQQIDAYGESNPWVQVNVFGRWPPASLNALLGPEDVRAAMGRTLEPSAYEWSQKRLGVDVARYGDDRTVVFPRQGLLAFRPHVMRHARGSAVSVDIANKVLTLKGKWHSELEFFDATGGWSAGAVDVMRSNGYGPMDVQFAAPALDPRFKNRRAELWWAMRSWVLSGGKLPNLPELVSELTAVTYMFNGGKFQLEEKDQVKKRIGRSPDLADALSLTFGLPDMPRGMAGSAGRVGKAKTFDSEGIDLREGW